MQHYAFYLSCTLKTNCVFFQAFDDAISELRQEDLGAHMVAIFVSDERFCCASKSYELCAVQANILVLRYLSVAWLLP